MTTFASAHARSKHLVLAHVRRGNDGLHVMSSLKECLPPALHRPQKRKKEKKADSADKPMTGSTSTSVFFLCTTFRNFAITPASPPIRKSATLRSTLWCSHYRVAKRKHFSCPLGTATVSLKLEMWLQAVRFVLSRVYIPWPRINFFLLLLHR